MPRDGKRVTLEQGIPGKLRGASLERVAEAFAIRALSGSKLQSQCSHHPTLHFRPRGLALTRVSEILAGNR